MKGLICLGVLIGGISVLLGVIGKFTGGVLWTVTPAAYLSFGATAFLGAISVGVLAFVKGECKKDS